MVLLICLCLLAACIDDDAPIEQPNKSPTQQPNGQPSKDNTGWQPSRQPDKSDEGTMTEKIYFTINQNKFAVTLEKNSATKALVELLKSGNITYIADDYGGFEKVGGLGHTLPRSDRQLTTQAGDVMLYLGNQIVMFYGSNSWSYTKLGKIEGYSTQQLRTLLAAGSGTVTVTISLD